MTKLATSTLGILLLNPIGCSGTLPDDTTGAGGSTIGTGGNAGVVHCDPRATAPCGPGKICQQTLFPIMPPPGYDGGMSDLSYLYECLPVGTGGSSATGGNPGTGGTVNAGGAKSTGTKSTKVAANSVRHDFAEDSWWKTAEAALPRT